METSGIPAGSTVYARKLANPLSRNIEQEISRGLSAIRGITEAHMPMCHVQEVMSEPAQIVAIVVDPAMVRFGIRDCG